MTSLVHGAVAVLFLLLSLVQLSLQAGPAGATQADWYTPCHGVPSINLIQVNPNVSDAYMWGYPQCNWISAQNTSNLFGTIYYSGVAYAFTPNASNGYFFAHPATLYGNPNYVGGQLTTLTDTAYRRLYW
jgi:hypothetical protein